MGDHRPFDLQASYGMADTVAIRFEQAGWSWVYLRQGNCGAFASKGPNRPVQGQGDASCASVTVALGT
jgi:hypothetical protein